MKKKTTIFLSIVFLALIALPNVVWGVNQLDPAEFDLPPTHVRLTNLIQSIVNWVVYIAGSACIIALMYGGIRYATAGGNEDRVDDAKKILKYAVIGVIVIMASYTITKLIVSAIGGDLPQPPGGGTE
ncbi:MAG: pilin [Patescibacteria group bacterium]|nr:pilin [Patescibacteria group bacterium]